MGDGRNGAEPSLSLGSLQISWKGGGVKKGGKEMSGLLKECVLVISSISKNSRGDSATREGCFVCDWVNSLEVIPRVVKMMMIVGTIACNGLK
jgi:hypothetical protein